MKSHLYNYLERWLVHGTPLKIDSFIWWMSPSLTRFDEKPPPWEFDKKPLWWIAAVVNSRFAEKPPHLSLYWLFWSKLKAFYLWHQFKVSKTLRAANIERFRQRLQEVQVPFPAVRPVRRLPNFFVDPFEANVTLDSAKLKFYETFFFFVTHSPGNKISTLTVNHSNVCREHGHKRIDRLLICTTRLRCFGWVVMLPATT